MARVLEGRNSISASEEASYVEAVEEFHKELKTKQSLYMSECKAIRTKIKDVLEEAKGQGGDPKAIKAVVKRRELEKKIAAHEAALEDDTQARFKGMLKALGGLADTPLGAAALKTAADDKRTAAVVSAVEEDLDEEEQAAWDRAHPVATVN